MSPSPDSAMPLVDLVIAIDTSVSMKDEAVGLSEAAEAAIEATKSSCPADLQVTWLGVEGTWNNTRFDRTIRDYFTQECQVAEADIRGRKRGMVRDDGAQEDGARAIEDIATHFNWRPGTMRAVFYLSDEGLEGGGNDVTQEAIEAADRAIATAKSAETTVYTYFGTTRSRNKEKLQQEFARVAHETGGQAFTDEDSIDGFTQILEQVICTTRNKVVDEPVTATIEAASAVAASATTSEPETPEVETPEAETPEVEIPEAETPEAETPEVETPEVETPEATAPEAAIYEATTSESEAETADMETPEVVTGNVTHRIVRNHALVATGIGLIPLPLADIAAVGVTQLLMIRKLSNFYDLPFSQHRAKAFITALLGAGQTGLILTSIGQLIPGIGVTGFTLTTAATTGVLTYAIGKVFVRHFETGGTFLDLDPNAMREYFTEQCREGKLVMRS